MMRFDILTLFPEMFTPVTSSILGKACDKNLLDFNFVDIREYSLDKHKSADDYSFGGGPGLVMMAQPIFHAMKAVEANKKKVIYMSPRGKIIDLPKLKELSRESEIVILCGHYEGVDERALELVCTDFISIGDYVLTGGELPAVIMIDAISRLVPGVLNNTDSAIGESFTDGLLEHPQYTRPETYMDMKVPEILLSGHQAKIEQWKLEEALKRTKERRPELYEEYLRTHTLPKKTKLPE